MSLKSMTMRMRNGRAWLVLGSGGMLFGSVPGCDPDVQAILVGGMEAAMTSAATAMIQALFQTITPSSVDGNVPTVMLDTVRDLITMFA